jgi:hypothetical protein
MQADDLVKLGCDILCIPGTGKFIFKVQLGRIHVL